MEQASTNSEKSGVVAYWLPALFVFLVGVAVLLVRQPFQQSIWGDIAYFDYMAQAILRGEPIYQTTTQGYPPTGALLTAATMLIGRLFDIPDYIAPRYLSIVLYGLSGILIYEIIYRVTKNHLYALWGGLLNFSFTAFMPTIAATIEPKLLVQLCSLTMIIAVQRKQWFIAGIACGVTGMTWHPSAIILITPLVIGFSHWRKTQWRGFFMFCVGILLGALPASLYLLLTGQIDDFITQGIIVKLTNPADFNENFFIHTWWLRTLFWDGLYKFLKPVFLISAIIGITTYTYQWWQKRGNDASQIQISEMTSPIIFLCITWIIYWQITAGSGAEMVAEFDFMLASHLLVFWAALGYGALHQAISRLEQTRILNYLYAVGMFGGIAFLLIYPAALYELRYSIHEQIDDILEALPANPDTDGWVAVSSPEVYVIMNEASPLPIIHFVDYFASYVAVRIPNGCQELVETVRQYDHVLYRIFYGPSGQIPYCLDDIVAYLEASPDEFSSITFGYGD